MQLSELIIQKIREEGALSFHDFMEMCLYYPGAGYYTSAKDKIGKSGDYYTSSSISPLFGTMIGKHLERMWNSMDKNDFTIVEYGAGTGMLCHDILNYLRSNPVFYDRLRYIIIEKSPAMRQKAKEHLPEKVSWCDSLHEIRNFRGCVFANELVDNFSVHRVVMKERLMEVFVGYCNGFIELLRPADKKLVDYLSELNVVLPYDFYTEINLEAVTWIKEIAACLEKGYVLTIDYGGTSQELYRPDRHNGTLTCYYHHTVNDRFYENIGLQDITSHVNFSALSHWGLKNGLSTSVLAKQAALLLSPGWEDCLNNFLLQGRQDNYINLRRYAVLKYTALVEMGQKFNVLVQQKGTPVFNLYD